MKTTKQTFYALLMLSMAIMLGNQLRGQTIATPTVYTTLASGPQTVSSVSINGPESWFKWTSGDGIAKLNAKIIQQGSAYRNSTAEFYTVLSVDSIKRVFIDSLNNDSTLHLVAGYLNSGDQIYIRFVNVSSSCATCFNLHPLVDFEIFSTTAGCYSSPCSLVRNGSFEQATSGVCAGYNVTDGIDCWYPYENSSDVFRRNCFANSGANNLGTNTYGFVPPINSHNGPSNNTIMGQQMYNQGNGGYYIESVQSLLASPLLPGRTYELSFWTYNVHSGAYNPMAYPCWVTFATASGFVSSPSTNLATAASFPSGLNVIQDFSTTPVNTWTAHTYTFTHSGAPASNLLVGISYMKNFLWGYYNDTDNQALYMAYDDIEIKEITTLNVTAATICAGQTATLTASGMNTYMWQPGNVSGPNYITNPIANFVYTVTGTDAGGCSKVKTTTVTVNPLPAISVWTPTVGICPGSSVTLVAAGGSNYTWTPCSLPSNCNVSNIVVSPSSNTTYTVTGSGSYGCTNTATASVSILNPNNSIQITGNTIVCPGQPAYLSATGATNYTWSPCTSGCNSAILTPTPGANTTYTVRGINACGVLSTQTVAVIVKTVYPILPDVLSGPVCPNYSVTLVANGGSPYSYTWTPGNIVGSMVTVTPSVTTTYTACTTVISCPSNCAAITVTVMPVPQMIITPVSFSVCAGTSANISVSGASSYTWSTGDNGPNVVVTPTASTVYTVSGSVHSCPTLTATSTAYVYPALTLTTAPHVSNCPGANTSITASGGPGTYTWTPGGMTGPIVVVSPTVPTVYTAASSANGCTLTANVTVNPVICCAVTGVPSFTATSGSLNGGTFTLNGSLYLSGDMTLDDITIFMGSNAEIIVPNNMKLTLNQCHFLGCPQMWKGIRFMGPNGSILITKNSLIEDAITAVDVSAVTAPYNAALIFFIETSVFNKNHTAISAANYNTNSGDYPMMLASNVFTSRKLYTAAHQMINPALPLVYNWPTATYTLLKGFVNMPDVFTPDIHLNTNDQFSIGTYSSSTMEIPNAGSVAHQGVRLKNIYSTNGNTTGFRMTAWEGLPYQYSNFNYYNVFDNMHYGVNAENTNLLVAHAAFQNMSQYVAGTIGMLGMKYYDGGMGINSIGTTANGLGSAQSYSLVARPVSVNNYNKSTNFFINNPYGIKTENIQNLAINFNVFHSSRTYAAVSAQPYNAPVGKGEYAVYVKSLDYRVINIKRNFTANINNGIIFIANSSTFMSSLQVQYGGSVNIADNILKANYGNTINAAQSMNQAIAVDNLISASAILLQNGPNSPVIVTNNIIDKAFNGIAVTNWNRQRVLNNTNSITLVNNGAVNYSQYAIRHSNNLGDNLIGNTVKGFGTGKQRVYAVMASENKGQSFWCNSSDNSYYGTVFAGSQNLTSWKQNTMSSHMQAMRLDNTTIGQQGAVGQPINNTWTGSWTGAFKTYVNGMIDPGSTTGNSKLYLSNVPSNLENGATSQAMRYKVIVPQSLFLTTGSSGVSCPSMQPSNPEPTVFSGYQPNLHNLVKNAYEYDTYLTGNRKNGKLAVYRILREDTTLLANDTILQNFKAASDAGNIGKLFKVEQYLTEGNYKDAEGRLSAIIPVDSVELGLKKLYKIYLRSKLNTYDAGDESDLIALANSCPAQMGIGVYQARVLLNSIYDVYYQYENDCGNTDNVAYRQIRNADEPAGMPAEYSFMIYPNPSSGVVYFTASDMGIESYEVTVYDITGKAIFMKEYTDGNTVNSIDLNLSNGMYLMQLTDRSNGEVHKQKFVIQK